MSVKHYKNGKLNLIAGAGSGGAVEDNIVYLTQAEYDALPESKESDDVEYRITDAGTMAGAENVGYNNSKSGIEAVNVQDAIDKLDDSLTEQPQFIYDETGKITGYTTKIGGADTVFPFSSGKNVSIERLKEMYTSGSTYTISEIGLYNLAAYARQNSTYNFYKNGTLIMQSVGASNSHNIQSNIYSLNEGDVISCSFSGTANGLISKIILE